MSWSTLHNGDMSSNVLENFTTYKGTRIMGSDRHFLFLCDCVSAIIDSSVDMGNLFSACLVILYHIVMHRIESNRIVIILS